jgi:hypothetical protein
VIRTGMDQREFHEPLADQQIDNSFDSAGLRDRPSDLVTPGVTPRSGIGAHLTPTKKKGKSRAVLVLHSRSKESAVSALQR